MGEAGRICSANTENSRIFLNSLRFAFKRSKNQVAIVLVQQKGNERISEAQTTICSASPIVIEIA
jgi:vacuolar-type H+-ATPase subunit F/Vma7